MRLLVKRGTSDNAAGVMGLYMGGRGGRRFGSRRAGSMDGYSDDGYGCSDADSEGTGFTPHPRVDHEKRALWGMLLQEKNIPQT